MKYLVLFLAVVCLTSCAHRQPAPVLQQPPALAASSTAAQSAEIAPIVVGAVATGCAAVGVGVALKEPHLVAAGASTAVGALALQRFLPWIPWLIAVAMAYLAIRYAVKHHLGSKLWEKDRTKLKEVYGNLTMPPAGPDRLQAVVDNLKEHIIK